MGNPVKDTHVAPPSHHRGPQGWWILTGVRVDVPEHGSEECPDEEGAEGDSQDGSQPQPTVCGRMRLSALPHWESPCPTPIPILTASLALNSQLRGRQASFTVNSRTFSKMVSFCGGGVWGERGKMCRGGVPQALCGLGNAAPGWAPSPNGAGQTHQAATAGGTSVVVSQGGEGVTPTCKPALHLRMAEKGMCLPSGTV